MKINTQESFTDFEARLEQYSLRLKERGTALLSSLLDKEFSDTASKRQKAKSSTEFYSEVAAFKQELDELGAALHQLQPAKGDAAYFPSFFGSTKAGVPAKTLDQALERLLGFKQILEQQAKNLVLLRVKEFKEKFEKFEKEMHQQENDLLESTQKNIKPSEILDKKTIELSETHAELATELAALKEILPKDLSEELRNLFPKSTSAELTLEQILETHSQKLSSSKKELEQQGSQLEMLKINEEFLRVIAHANDEIADATRGINARLKKFADALREVGEIKLSEDDQDEKSPKRKVDREALKTRINGIMMKYRIPVESESRMDRRAEKSEIFNHVKERLINLRNIERTAAEGDFKPAIDKALLDVTQYLKTKNPNINFCNEHGQSALHLIIQAQNIHLLESLLSQKGVAVNYSSVADNDPYITDQIDRRLQGLSGYDKRFVGMFESHRQQLKDELIGDHPLDEAFKTGNTNSIMMLILAGGNVRRMFSEERDNGGTIGIDPRRSPLISIASHGFHPGRSYSIEQLAQMRDRFGGKTTLPIGVEAGTTESAKTWAATMIMQQMTPDDIMKDLKYLKKQDNKDREIEFILHLATSFSTETLQKEGFHLEGGKRRSSLTNDIFSFIGGSFSTSRRSSVTTPTNKAKKTPSTSPLAAAPEGTMEQLHLGPPSVRAGLGFESRSLRDTNVTKDAASLI